MKRAFRPLLARVLGPKELQDVALRCAVIKQEDLKKKMSLCDLAHVQTLWIIKDSSSYFQIFGAILVPSAVASFSRIGWPLELII